MDQFLSRYGSWGIVAGAAEGLGEAYCISLAKKGMNILLVDKEKMAMDSLADRLENEYGIKTQGLHLDLGHSDSAKVIIERAIDHDCRLLIYNAAKSIVQPFLAHEVRDLDQYLDTNCRTMLHSVYGLLKHLKGSGTGGILLMSSLAGLWGTQLVASYGATKAFTLNLAEALYHELKDHDIDIMACIAGPTATPAYLSTNPRYGFFKPRVMKPQDVADYALDHLGKKAFCIPGFSNRFSYFLMNRILSRTIATRLINTTMSRMYN
jgi:short-subunit dehydrogenase